MLPAEPIDSLTALEERLAAEEEHICERMRTLEHQVQTLHEHKAAAAEARRLAEAAAAGEAELAQWEASLLAEVERATSRLNDQRQVQLERCTAFDVALGHKVASLQQMQLDVRRRAAALDTAYDACMQRIQASCTESVALRRATHANGSDATAPPQPEPSTAAPGRGSVAPPPPADEPPPRATRSDEPLAERRPSRPNTPPAPPPPPPPPPSQPPLLHIEGQALRPGMSCPPPAPADGGTAAARPAPSRPSSAKTGSARAPAVAAPRAFEEHVVRVAAASARSSGAKPTSRCSLPRSSSVATPRVPADGAG